MLSLKMVKGAELADGVVAEMKLPEPLTRFSIGRDPANQWPIPDRTLAISARHCEIVRTAAGVALRDVSTNGTFVNGGAARLAGDHLLQDGDRIELGPYTILVQGQQALRAAAVPGAKPGTLPSIPPLRPPPTDGPPVRGGDPAAMLSGAGPARPGLTEILREQAPEEPSDLAVTKIRAAPKPPPSPPMRSMALRAEIPPAAAPVMVLPPGLVKPPARVAPPAMVTPPVPVFVTPAGQAAAPAPAPAAAPGRAAKGAEPLLQQLAAGLGLPADALNGRDVGQTLAQVGGLARTALTVLRQLLEQQAQARRQIGSRAPALTPVREVSPLRLSASVDSALLTLLAPGGDVKAPLQRAGAELAAHQERLMAAFRDAVTKLGEEMAPISLESALPGPGDAAHQARLWELYAQLWPGIGLAPDQPWSKGFLEAALLHLAAAYDEHGKR